MIIYTNKFEGCSYKNRIQCRYIIEYVPVTKAKGYDIEKEQAKEGPAIEIDRIQKDKLIFIFDTKENRDRALKYIDTKMDMLERSQTVPKIGVNPKMDGLLDKDFEELVNEILKKE